MIVSDLPLNSELTIGMSVGYEDAAPMVWVKVSEQNDFLMTQICSYMMFDAEERDPCNQTRCRYGNNFYPHSNIHQWLNSFHGPYEKMHEFDNIDYIHGSGFLSCFAPHELDSIMDRQINVVPSRGNRKEFGSIYPITVKVTLPSLSELFQDSPSHENDYLPALRSAALNFASIMTRTGINNPGRVAYYNPSGSFFTAPASNSGPVIPMIRLRPDTVLDTKNSEIAIPDHYWVYERHSEILSEIITSSR